MNSRKQHERRKKIFERKLIERCADYLLMRDAKIITRLVQNSSHIESENLILHK